MNTKSIYSYDTKYLEIMQKFFYHNYFYLNNKNQHMQQIYNNDYLSDKGIEVLGSKLKVKFN